jgi:hypothetical protein
MERSELVRRGIDTFVSYGHQGFGTKGAEGDRKPHMFKPGFGAHDPAPIHVFLSEIPRQHPFKRPSNARSARWMSSRESMVILDLSTDVGTCAAR